MMRLYRFLAEVMEIARDGKAQDLPVVVRIIANGITYEPSVTTVTTDDDKVVIYAHIR